MTSPNVDYTIAQVDEAIRVIAGHHAVRPGDWGWSRPHACLSAASRAWIEERPEDEHSAILRSAIRDLDEHGFFKPVDGAFPKH